MNDFDDNSVSDRACVLWEKEGRPDGRALDHWVRAVKELEGADAEDHSREFNSSVPSSNPIEQTDGPGKIPLYP